MANNLRVFNTNSEYQSADLVHPAVSYVIETDKVHYEPTPPTPSIKWKATYSNGSVTSAECGSSSEIVRNEISLTNLVSVEIGDCVTSIGDWVLNNCINLTSVTIGSGVTTIGIAAFINCRSLTSVTCLATTPPTLGIGTFDGSTCPIYVPCESVNAYKSASGWSDYASRITCIQPSYKWKVTFSNDTTSSGACSSNTELTSSELPLDRFVKLEVGDCCTIVGANLSGRLSGVTSVTISDSVTKIGIRMLNNCSKLKTVEVGSGVTRIDDWFVNSCTVLTSVTIKATTPPTLGTACFTNSNDCPIYVPSQSVQTYKTTSGWNIYASRIQAIQE